MSDDNQMLIAFAGEKKLKTFEDKNRNVGVVRGYGILFDVVDLQGERFGKETYYGVANGDNVTATLNHTVPIKTESAEVNQQLETFAEKTFTNPVHTTKTDYGIIGEHVLELSNKFEAWVFELVKKGGFSWSTGALSHTFRKDADGFVKRWDIGEFGYTPTPAQPLNKKIAPVKMLEEISLEVHTKGDTMETEKEVETNNEEAEREVEENTKDENEEEKDEGANDGCVSVGDGNSDAVEGVEATKQLTETLKMLNDKLKFPANDTLSVKDAADKAKEAIKSGFEAYYRYGQVEKYVGAVKRYGKALTTERPGAGFTVPDVWANELVQGLMEGSILRIAGARIITPPSGNSYRVPAMAFSGMADLIGEGQSYLESEPTFLEIVFNPFKFTHLGKATDELLYNSMFPVLEQILLPDATNAFIEAENRYFTVGAGNTEPEGVMTNVTTGVVTSDPADILPDEVISLFYALPYIYRANAVWMMNDQTIAHLHGMVDGNGQPLWQPSLQLGQPATLLGRPVFTNNYIDDFGSPTAKPILFGDLSYFWISDFENGAVGFKRLDELYADTGHVGFRWYKMTDSHPVLSDAFIAMECGTIRRRGRGNTTKDENKETEKAGK